MNWLEKISYASHIYWYKGNRPCKLMRLMPDARHLALVQFEDDPDRGWVQVYTSQLREEPDPEVIERQENQARQEPDILCPYCGKLGKDPNFCRKCGREIDE